MINIEIDEKDGFILSLNVQGHANYNKIGTDIVCASVSTLINTFLTSCEVEKCISYKCNTDKRGVVSFECNSVEQSKSGIYTGLCSFLIVGLKRLSIDFSNNINIRNIGVNHGT